MNENPADPLQGTTIRTRATPRMRDGAPFVPPAWALRHPVRPRLTDRIMAAPPGSVVLLRGPAGCGKTVVLADCWRSARAAGRRVAWLDLSPADAAAPVLLSRVVAALEALDVRVPRRDAHEATSRLADSIELAARELCRRHDRTLNDCTLIFDGLEAIAGTAAAAWIAALIAYTRHATIALGSRGVPALPLAALRAQRRAIEIGPHDLAFRLHELRALVGDAIPDEYLLMLLRSCDGMAIAIDLAVRAMSAQPAPFDTNAPESWLEDLARYFREQVLSDIAPELRRLLAKLSIVEQFDVSLASALCGRDAGGQVRELYRDHCLIVRDRTTGLFHLPAALRSCLESEREWDDAAELARVHVRAADWFARRALPHEAAMHALLSRDPSLTTRYYEPVGPTSLGARLGMQPMFEALCASTQPEASLSLDLALIQDMVYTRGGLVPDPPCVLEDRVADGSSQGPEDLIVTAFVRGYRDEVPSEAELCALRELALRTTMPDLASRGLARNLLCWDGLRAGRLDEAAQWADLAEHDFLCSNAVYANAFIHLLRVPILVWQNDLTGAGRQAALAQAVARLLHPEDLRLENLSQLMAAWVDHELGRPLGVDHSRELARALALGERWPDAVSLGFMLAARASEASGNRDGALAILDSGIVVTGSRHQRRALWSLRCERVRQTARAGDLASARSDAEQLGLGATGLRGRAATGLTWREEIDGLDAYVTLSLASNDHDAARAGAATLRTRAREHRLPRIELLAHRAEANRARAAGDTEAASRAQAAAMAVHCSAPGSGDALHVNVSPARRADPSLLPASPQVPAVLTQSQTLLTPRESALLELVAAGLSNKQVAWRLKLSEATVKFHIRNIYRKVGARNRIQALARLRGPVTVTFNAGRDIDD